MKRFSLLFTVLSLFALLFTPVFAAFSSSDAVLFVTEENHFLEKTEDVEQPTVAITHGNIKYWVLPVIRGTDVVTFIPIHINEKTVSQNQAVNEQLFSTANFLRSYLTYKNSLASQNKKWFLGSDNQLIIENLSTSLKDSVYRLNIVKSEFPEGSADSAKMQTNLNSMASSAATLSQSIFEFLQTESEFVSAPDTGKTAAIKDQQAATTELLLLLETQAREYKSQVSALKLKISNSNLPADKKNNFTKLVDPPEELYTIGSTSIGNWVILSNEALAQVQSIYTSSKSKTFLEDASNAFTVRNNQNATYAVLFGLDNELKTKTPYPTLETAIKDIASEQKKSTWTNQDQLQEAYTNWQNASEAYDNKQYDLAKTLGQKSKKAVLRVIADGTVEIEPDPINWDLLMNALIAGFILIILLYFVKNRNKIIGAIAQPAPEEGVDLNAWKRNM